MNKSGKVDPLVFQLFEFTPRKGDLRKLEIVKAAMECICKEGIEHTSFDKIGARLGIGRALLEKAIADARRRRLVALTLTTFRDVIWNAPFYQKLGFRVMDDAQAGERLRQPASLFWLGTVSTIRRERLFRRRVSDDPRIQLRQPREHTSNGLGDRNAPHLPALRLPEGHVAVLAVLPAKGQQLADPRTRHQQQRHQGLELRVATARAQ